jgi:hypothetical protein
MKMTEEGVLLVGGEEASVVEPDKDHFPMCIVWSMLSWLLPVSGHLGMVDASGVVSDFAGSCYIHNHKRRWAVLVFLYLSSTLALRTAFGPVTKYVVVRPGDLHGLQPGESAAAGWNRALASANRLYAGREHNLLLDNCHHHVAVALNELRYRGRQNWGTVSLHLLMMRHARFVSPGRCATTYVGTLVILALVLLIVLLVRLL